MERRDFQRERVDVRCRHRAAREHSTEQRVLRELPHLYGVLENRTVTANGRIVHASRDRHDFQIDARREAAVQPEFLFTVEVAGGKRREVQEFQVNRFLNLVSVRPRQQNVRDVCFQDGDALDFATVHCGITQRPNERCLARDAFGRRVGDYFWLGHRHGTGYACAVPGRRVGGAS